MKKDKRSLLLSALGVTVSTVPVAIATLSYFPLWVERSSYATFSGFTLLLLILAATPIVKILKRRFTSPSVTIVWLMLFLVFSMLKSIVYEVTVIAFVGFVSNSLGALIYYLAKKRE